MVMAKLHVICGNCGCADLWELTIERDGDDISSDHEAYEDSASLYCGNCSTLHNLKDSAKKVTFGSGATSPVPAQQPGQCNCIRWKSKTVAFRAYVDQKTYDGFTPEVQKWYEPILTELKGGENER